MHALVVDDESELAKGLAQWLKEAGAQTTTAANGKIAKEYLEKNEVDLVLSDIRMPELTGVELLKWVRQNKPKTQVVLITGYSEFDAQEMLGLGSAGFLTKPIQKNELLECIKSLRDDFMADQSSGMQFAKIRLDSFIIGKKSPFSIYIKMADGRFVKVVNKDAELDMQRVERFQKNNVYELWIEKQELPTYLEICRKLNQIAKNSTHTAENKSQKMAQNLMDVSMEGLKTLGVNESSIKTAVTDFKEASEVLFKNPAGLNQIESFQSQAQQLYTSATISTSLMAGVLKLMGWQAKKNIQAVLLATFLRDIALAQHQDLMKKRRRDMTPEELEIFKSHPAKSVELLKNIPDLPQATLTIIEQHHENARGDGFPAGLNSVKIFPMAKMVQTLDHLLHEISLADPGITKDAARLDALLTRIRPELSDHPTTVGVIALLTLPSPEKAKEFFSKNAYAIGVRLGH